MDAFLNVSTYAFAPVADPPALRERVFAAARDAQLRGTVLIAEEGINLFVAGAADSVRGFLAFLREDCGFEDLPVKESWSAAMPYRQLKVKVKREIIRMNRPAVRPAAGRAPALPAATLKRWLDQGHDDEGRPVVMLDTRNAFEVDHGAFEGAVDWRLAKFSDFPQAFESRAGELAGMTIVSYCTGGIRCEKAALVMREAGLEHVWQLEGGILRYFEDTGGVHFRGHCFVFDERHALNTKLRPAVEPAGG